MTLEAEAIPPRRHPARQWLVPAAVGALVLSGIVAVVILAQRAGTSDAPPPPGAFATPEAAGQTVTFDVQQAHDGQLNLATPLGPQASRFPPDVRGLALRTGTPIEVLTPAAITNIEPGDWVTVVGVFNEVRNFSIRSVIVVESPGKPPDDGIVRSPAGFTGAETAKDRSERPIFGGTVKAVANANLTLETSTGTVTLSLAPGAPIYLIATGNAGSIIDGSRVAFLVPGGVGLESASAVLVQRPAAP